MYEINFVTIDSSNKTDDIVIEKVREAKVNEIRKQIVDPLIELKEKIKSNKDATNITKTLYEFLESNEIKEIINEKVKHLEMLQETKLAKEYVSSYDALIRVFDEIALVFKDQKMSFDQTKIYYNRLTLIDLNQNIPTGYFCIKTETLYK